ncbi:hypothetical protein Tco_0780556 [Tanacetum coccineum]
MANVTSMLTFFVNNFKDSASTIEFGYSSKSKPYLTLVQLINAINQQGVTLKKDFHEVNFQIYSNPLFEFDDNFKSSNVNPLFEENDKDTEINSSSSFTLTSPKESEFEVYLEKDSILPGIDLNLPPTLEVSSSNPTSPTLTGEKVHSWKTPMILSTSLLDTDSPFHWRKIVGYYYLEFLSENVDKVFKPGILVYHAIHAKNLVTLEENLKEKISSGTLLVFKEPSFLLPSPEPLDDFLNFEPNLVMKNVVLNEDFYQSKKTLPLNVEDVDSFTFIIWTFLPYFTYTEESPLIFSFRSENFVFDPGIVTFHKPVGYIINHKTKQSEKRQQTQNTRNGRAPPLLKHLQKEAEMQKPKQGKSKSQ